MPDNPLRDASETISVDWLLTVLRWNPRGIFSEAAWKVLATA